MLSNNPPLPTFQPLEKQIGPGEPFGWKYPSSTPQRPPQGAALPAAPPATPKDDVSSFLADLTPDDMSFLRQLIAQVRSAMGKGQPPQGQPQGGTAQPAQPSGSVRMKYGPPKTWNGYGDGPNGEVGWSK